MTCEVTCQNRTIDKIIYDVPMINGSDHELPGDAIKRDPDMD